MTNQSLPQKELKYYRLMEDLKEKILSGEFKAGDKLPSENELAYSYQISRQTVRKALSILENAGLIGLPVPGMIKKALEQLREKGDNEDGKPPDEEEI